MIFRFRVVASREMIVLAVAIKAGYWVGSTEQAVEFIKVLRKEEIKEIVAERIEINGKEAMNWGEVETPLYTAAHRRVDELWPDHV